MKNSVLLFIAMFLPILASSQSSYLLLDEDILSNEFSNIFVDLPGYRETKGGSKLVVTYSNDCPAELIGAFNYAVKLWEEVLPMVAPINIKVDVKNIRGNNTISNTSMIYYNYEGDLVNLYNSPSTQIKSVLLQEYHQRDQIRFANEIEDAKIFDEFDIEISYNKNLLNQISFSLDGEPGVAKYDFVTIALRDIAKGLGFTANITADTKNKKLLSPGERVTPYQQLIWKAIGTSDLYEAFNKATTGNLIINQNRFGQELDRSLNIYAPQTWINGTSLNYLIPDGSKIADLLAYNFGKGYVMHDLTGEDWNELFKIALDWRAESTTGFSGGGASMSGNTNDVLPYKGKVLLSVGREYPYSDTQLLIKNKESQLRMNKATSEPISVDSYCDKYNLYSQDGPPSGDGRSLSVQRKDGTWECLYKIGNNYTPIEINIENFALSLPNESYARTTNGGLRYRFTECSLLQDNLSGFKYHTYKTKYFTREFLPQKAEIKYSKIHQENEMTASRSSDEYFIDVEIGLANMEGTNRVVVEQWDEGEVLPFEYEIEDFRKGYFVANLDREISTKLVVYSYNENGSQRSDAITIPPLGYPEDEVEFNLQGNNINITGLRGSNLSYSITNLFYNNTTVAYLEDNNIDISSLAKGTYVINVYNSHRSLGTFKFVK